jgi:hypothetical protein
MKLKPGRLHVSVDDHDGLISIQDTESMKAFWLLMSQRTGLSRTTATSALNDGQLILGKDLAVNHHDIFCKAMGRAAIKAERARA